MRDGPSTTAAWVAVWRGLGGRLPADARLADDPYGLAFGGPWTARALRAPAPILLPLRPFLLFMQVRTRAIDDVFRAFVAEGGDQVLILGAGYDARALRFAEVSRRGRVFEVDHPATQARKRALLPHSPAVLLPWDFERQPVAGLPAALARAGHDPAHRTLTVWEGVTMYLSEDAVDASVRAVAALSAPGSPFVVTYHDRANVEHPGLARRVVSRALARAGEPFRFGWDPAALPGWLRDRGLGLAWDRAVADLAAELLPRRHARVLRMGGRSRIALFTRRP